jgi:hypothetical protein
VQEITQQDSLLTVQRAQTLFEKDLSENLAITAYGGVTHFGKRFLAQGSPVYHVVICKRG